MREPVPFVRATLATNGNGNGKHPPFPDDVRDDDERDDEVEDDEYAFDDESDAEDERAELESAREVASNEAPWSPTPVRPARQFQRDHDDAQINIVFPTVYEEDRSAKLKDLMTAEAVSAISHQRMAEQIAKELGFEQYDYRAELQSIQVETKKLPPDVEPTIDQIAGVNPQLNAPPPPPGAQPPGAPPTTRAKIGAPTPGLARDEEPTPPVRRADLSGDSAHEFRKQQRDMHGKTAEVLTEMVQHLRATREALATQADHGAQNSDAIQRFVEAIDSAFSRLESRLSTPLWRDPPPAPPVVNVQVPEVDRQAIEDQAGRNVRVVDGLTTAFTRLEEKLAKPRKVVVVRDERGLITEMRDES